MDTVTFQYTGNGFTISLLQNRSLYEHINLAVLNVLGYVMNIFTFLKKTDQSFILCYHSISDNGWRFSTPVEEFEKQIKYLKEHYEIKSLAEILEGKKGVAITFDDGYEDNYTEALPILKKYGVTATVFIIGDPKNVHREKLENGLELMNLSQVLLLKEAGWEIGFHTVTHPSLIELTEEEQSKEIINGKKETETKLGIEMNYFAYPLGLYNKSIIKKVKEASFKAAFTVNGGMVSTRNLYTVDRIGVEGTFTFHQFKAFISPLGIFITRQFMKILQLKEFIINLIP